MALLEKAPGLTFTSRLPNHSVTLPAENDVHESGTGHGAGGVTTPGGQLPALIAMAPLPCEPRRDDGLRICRLIARIEPVDPETPVNDVANTFTAHPEIEALPVVSGGRPCGLLTRAKLSQRLFTRFGYALYGRKPVLRLIEQGALEVPDSMLLDEVLNLALRRPPENVYDDVIVTDRAGEYAGIVSVGRMVVEQGEALASALFQRELARRRAEEAEEITRVKSEFLTNVTHELRAPVNTMIGLAELMETALQCGDAAKVAECAAIFRSSAAALRGLVNNVLDLAKIEAGRVSVLAEEVDPAQIVREVAEAVRVLSRGKPVEVAVELPEGPRLIWSDPVMIRQILLNLGNNAAKFTEAGRIGFSLEDRELSIVFKVSDTGPGIPPEQQARLFVAFNQVASSTTKRHEGTGLGLAITRHLAGLLNGRIDLQSEVGKGSVFTVELPCQHQEEREGQ